MCDCVTTQLCNDFIEGRVPVGITDTLTHIGGVPFGAGIPVAQLITPNSPLKIFAEGTREGQFALYTLKRDWGMQEFTFLSAGAVTVIPTDAFDRAAIRVLGSRPTRPKIVDAG